MSQSLEALWTDQPETPGFRFAGVPAAGEWPQEGEQWLLVAHAATIATSTPLEGVVYVSRSGPLWVTRLAVEPPATRSPVSEAEPATGRFVHSADCEPGWVGSSVMS